MVLSIIIVAININYSHNKDYIIYGHNMTGINIISIYCSCLGNYLILMLCSDN